MKKFLLFVALAAGMTTGLAAPAVTKKAFDNLNDRVERLESTVKTLRSDVAKLTKKKTPSKAAVVYAVKKKAATKGKKARRTTDEDEDEE